MADLRKAILTADDVATDIVDVPEWGVKVGVRGMTITEQLDFLNAVGVGSDADVATLTLDDPGALNALSTPMLESLAAALVAMRVAPRAVGGRPGQPRPVGGTAPAKSDGGRAGQRYCPQSFSRPATSAKLRRMAPATALK